MRKTFTLLFIFIFSLSLKPGFGYTQISTNHSPASINFYNSTNTQQLTLFDDAINYTEHFTDINSPIHKKISPAFAHPGPLKIFSKVWFNTHGKYITGKIFEVKETSTNKTKNTSRFNSCRYASTVYVITTTGEKKRNQTLTLSKE